MNIEDTLVRNPIRVVNTPKWPEQEYTWPAAVYVRVDNLRICSEVGFLIRVKGSKCCLVLFIRLANLFAPKANAKTVCRSLNKNRSSKSLRLVSCLPGVLNFIIFEYVSHCSNV
jgi:hypothetical protein